MFLSIAFHLFTIFSMIKVFRLFSLILRVITFCANTNPHTHTHTNVKYTRINLGERKNEWDSLVWTCSIAIVVVIWSVLYVCMDPFFRYSFSGSIFFEGISDIFLHFFVYSPLTEYFEFVVVSIERFVWKPFAMCVVY